ncbi:hypothetical protein SKAU_G00143320 [Synaphobranchus kaupii]|uniref:Uncharacterized protein n=1 Tax=Synaphobranchus kaupii TaxID=118154 RepID=A0A9Q1FSM2_SYNKA|nr:hypothetical protein SKAU_G00143320 [Synaphobranchus kaupii]
MLRRVKARGLADIRTPVDNRSLWRGFRGLCRRASTIPPKKYGRWKRPRLVYWLTRTPGRVDLRSRQVSFEARLQSAFDIFSMSLLSESKERRQEHVDR